MTSGISGSLLSLDALEKGVLDDLGVHVDAGPCSAAQRRLRAWHARVEPQLGPASGARTVFDRVAAPLCSALGYRVLPARSHEGFLLGLLQSQGAEVASLLVTPWGIDLSAAWRLAVRHGLAHDLRWCFCVNGRSLRVIDTRRTYSRRHLEIDLRAAFEDHRTFQVLWLLLRAAGMRPPPKAIDTTLDRAVALCEQHRSAIRSSLQKGVEEALLHLVTAFAAAGRPRRRPASRVIPGEPSSEALVVIYRILFLLFAEARGAVPRWHRVFRESYTIESLRPDIELLPRPKGLWESLQAISRLAHKGCHAGALRVTAFNGRLFSPADAPAADTLRLDDGLVRKALLELTTRPGKSGRERIAYGDLGVEQLGGIYERLLDFEPSTCGRSGTPSLVRTERRKATGSFYTPRSITEFLVRRTLAPLVAEASPEQVLSLRVLDPAMGSGAFLVAACRYLASAYEAAVLRESGMPPSEIDDQERASFRRTVAQRCLYGVDLNPMAVQLGRLSLWLTTLAADRPLTFLDHRLRIGNSLVGCRVEDMLRQPPGPSRRNATSRLPLFVPEDLENVLVPAIGGRLAIANEPGDSVDQVRSKERSLTAIESDDDLVRWKQLSDLWCSWWFRKDGQESSSRAVFGDLFDAVAGRRHVLPEAEIARLLERTAVVARAERFFHWTLEFPEVFRDPSGAPLASAGFDAILGNPPWEMLRADRGSAATRREARGSASSLLRFSRDSGIYALQGRGHSNLYQMFLERALSLVRRGGRIGLVLPSGFATDHGCGPLRRAMLDRTEVDTLVGIENRDGVFPIHRSVRFLLLTATAGRTTPVLPCRFGIRRPEVLDALPDSSSDPATVPVPRGVLERVSGPESAIPDLRSPADLEILSSLALRVPALSSPEGWGVTFGRELNATDDRRYFTRHGPGLPVLEGKHVHPFQVHLDRAELRIARNVAARLLPGDRAYRRARLAYRDVAAATNRQTLIAAVLPPGTVTTHTLFCLKEDLPTAAQHYLCGVFNSYVANFVVRCLVGTHVSIGVVARLPVPKPPRDGSDLREISALAARLAASPHDAIAAARLQARVARSYGLDRARFEHLLNSFPLVPPAERAAALAAFCDIVS